MLRYFKLWWFIGWLLVIAICYLSLAPIPPDFDIKFKYVDKLEHFLTYLLLTGWFAQLYQTKQSRLFYLVFFILMGMLLEVLQGLGTVRVFEYSDIVANSAGVLMAWQITKGRLKNLLLYFETQLIS
ncbi:MAG: hypothetical protein BMS9Abin31_0314 [Gammaproteobacteria bacterium]|nr:MAG: hypothetical protein BMS9Abin31_0314 [Gammaproteobacteria bacterium]